ncbi:unnamed protein product [Brassica rapa subsp. narinosa]
MDRVGGEKLEVGTGQRIRIRRYRRTFFRRTQKLFIQRAYNVEGVGGNKHGYNITEIVGYPDFPVTEGNSEPLRCIVTRKQPMFGFMSGANITDITTQLKQTELGTSNLMECYLHNPVSFLEAVQPDLFKYKK